MMMMTQKIQICRYKKTNL